eukprot:TRINITY_DN4021_c0_g1_i1.p1 TRINITY_DN4021_c0_g1~~TRINITY_DN4021_c0_g1_i1.p1  ORF type:complete len:137 (-),score=61.55 TRINITY_DN4021_c0_g1_i1:46-456(-)
MAKNNAGVLAKNSKSSVQVEEKEEMPVIAENDEFGKMLSEKGMGKYVQSLRQRRFDLNNFKDVTESDFQKIGVPSKEISHCMNVVREFKDQRIKETLKRSHTKPSEKKEVSSNKNLILVVILLFGLLLLYLVSGKK